MSLDEFFSAAGTPDESASYTFEIEGQIFTGVPITVLDETVLIHLAEAFSVEYIN